MPIWKPHPTYVLYIHDVAQVTCSAPAFCGYVNSTYNSGARCGDRGPFHMFSIQNPAGSLSSDLQIGRDVHLRVDV